MRAIVFDLDGTLIDSYTPIATSLNHARAHFDLPALSELQIRRRVGRGLERLVAELVGEDRIEQGVRLFREQYSEIFVEQTSLMPRARETLRELRESGYRMAVASNKPERFATPILRGVGLLPFLDHVQGPDRKAPPKPDPLLIRTCLRRMNTSPAEGLYVGDMVLDVESAARAGLAVALIEGGSSELEALQRTGERIVPSLAALPALLRGIAG